MSTSDNTEKPQKPTLTPREARLKAALRDNLRRRKAPPKTADAEPSDD